MGKKIWDIEMKSTLFTGTYVIKRITIVRIYEKFLKFIDGYLIHCLSQLSSCYIALRWLSVQCQALCWWEYFNRYEVSMRWKLIIMTFTWVRRYDDKNHICVVCSIHHVMRQYNTSKGHDINRSYPILSHLLYHFFSLRFKQIFSNY